MFFYQCDFGAHSGSFCEFFFLPWRIGKVLATSFLQVLEVSAIGGFLLLGIQQPFGAFDSFYHVAKEVPSDPCVVVYVRFRLLVA